MGTKKGKALTPELANFINEFQEKIETSLRFHLPASSMPGTERFNDALDYAVFPGGKRLRPIITLLAGRLVSANDETATIVACAIEFLHTSSLILDDLPGMDDADLRRNKQALHLVFGEGLAVLAAVALLNQAYALLAVAASGAPDERRSFELLKEATRCIGPDGMIGGQVVDLESHATQMDESMRLHRDAKTIALMRLMMTANALATGATEEDCAALAGFGERIGEAYQICDDLIDEWAESSMTGKTPGQDARHWRPTAIAELGKARAFERASAQLEMGNSLLRSRFGARTEVELLLEISNFVTRVALDAACPSGLMAG